MALPTPEKSLLDVVRQLEDWSRGEAYVRGSEVKQLEFLARGVVLALEGSRSGALPQTPVHADLARAREFLADPETERLNANKRYIREERRRAGSYLEMVESKPLTDEQCKAVVIDDDRNLVVAAAGSGKTSIVVGKAGWLVHTARRRPCDLLLLAFGNAARNELATRIRKRLGAEVALGMSVRTFHELGLAVIGELEGRRPTLAKAAEDPNTLAEVLEEMMQEPSGVWLTELVNWLAYESVPYREPHDFKSWHEYWNYVRNHEIRSLKGDRVKSLEECRIANFLYLNGIDYEYERQYEHDTATAQRSQYRPDFHLRRSGIYIEHFAFAKDGKTPPFIDNRRYTRDREWKLKLHKRHGTILVQTFSHEQAAGRLTENLERKLRKHGVEMRPIPREEVFDALNKQGRVGSFARLAATFLDHFKGSGKSLAEVAGSATGAAAARRTHAFLQAFCPLLERYEERLSAAGEIDFHDMISRATDHVRSGRYKSPFSHILVDEFQDISPGRASLVQALLAQREDAKLFAVGDDWQSVYRFAGSDLAIMRHFERNFGPTTQSVLETTFRCGAGVTDVATRFILRNPSQIRKKVRTTRRVAGPGVWVGIGSNRHALLRDTLKRIASEVRKGCATVLVLGRYTRTKPHDWQRVTRAYGNLDLSYSTVHRAKGQEADYVVVLGVSGGKYGFPSEMADDPLLDLVLAAAERFPNAEERRLFYVALTRARRRTFVLTDPGVSSPFATELLRGDYNVECFGDLQEQHTDCPECGGRQVPRRNRTNGNLFYGCANYPYCRRTSRAQSPSRGARHAQ